MSMFLGVPRRANEKSVVTYRHLLSPAAMNVFNPLRTIGHCDIDGAFAQFEQWNSIIAVNYPARAFGIKRSFTGTIEDAKKLCPTLVVQHVATYREGETEAGYWDEVDRKTQKISLDPYRRESLKILAVFREMAPTAELEKASIDEAFMDLTAMAIERLLAAHPHLAAVPHDAPNGLDTPLPAPPPIDWTRAGNIIPIAGDVHDDEGVEAEQEEEPVSWDDWALCLGAEIMAEVRAEVWKRLHYTCSAGIAHSKSMAKICSAWKKPNAQTVLRQSATPGFLFNMEFTDIRFLGGKLGQAIATEFNAKTVGDLLKVSLEDMQAKFGEDSIWVYNIIRGIDHTEVKEKLSNKSMLASKNTFPNVTTPEQGHHWLGVLAGELKVRLNEARDVTPGLWPKTIVLYIRSVGEASRSRQIAFPFSRHLSAEYIAKFGRKLWDEMTQPMKRGTMKLNNIALAFHGLEQLEEGQRGIEGFFSTQPAPKRPRESEPRENGEDSLSPGVEAGPSTAKRTRLPPLMTGKQAPTGLDAFLTRGQPKAVKTELAMAEPPLGQALEAAVSTPVPDGRSWACPKCGETLEVSADFAASLDQAKQEHEDYHFALDLQRAHSGSSASSSRSTPRGREGSAKASKPKAKPTGIKAFFAPRQ